MLCVSKGDNVVPTTLGNQTTSFHPRPVVHRRGCSSRDTSADAETRRLSCEPRQRIKGVPKPSTAPRTSAKRHERTAPGPALPFGGARVGTASLIQESEDSGSRFSGSSVALLRPIQIVNINLRPTPSCCKWGFGFTRQRDSLPSRGHNLMAEAATAAAAGVTSGMDYKNPRIEKEPSGGPYHDDRSRP